VKELTDQMYEIFRANTVIGALGAIGEGFRTHGARLDLFSVYTAS